MQPEIRDGQVFDINSPWYPLLVKLFKELSRKSCIEGHKHHWIPCSVVAMLLSPSVRQTDYRAFADKAYPQPLVRMPVSAHILIHYLTWQAVHVRFKSMMQCAFEGLWGMNPPSDKYTHMLDAYMAEGPTAKEKPAKHRGEKSKRGPSLGRESRPYMHLVHLAKVKGHSGDRWNDFVDRLAREAIYSSGR